MLLVTRKMGACLDCHGLCSSKRELLAWQVNTRLANRLRFLCSGQTVAGVFNDSVPT
jgi:hypothetical protein